MEFQAQLTATTDDGGIEIVLTSINHLSEETIDVHPGAEKK